MKTGAILMNKLQFVPDTKKSESDETFQVKGKNYAHGNSTNNCALTDKFWEDGTQSPKRLQIVNGSDY